MSYLFDELLRRSQAASNVHELTPLARDGVGSPDRADQFFLGNRQASELD